jgi:hypothetical protein
MKKLSLKLFIISFLFQFMSTNNAYAQMDGGAGWANYVYLIKIYQENLKRFIQIKTMIDQAHSHDQYIRALNEGLNNATGLLQATPLKDERILAQLRQFQDALTKVEQIYGIVPKGSDSELQKLHDMTIAESLKLSNSSRDYAELQEQNANQVFYQSATASPKGAERMNAQTSAQILHSINQLIKVNGQILKMQGEAFAYTNKQEKDSTQGFNKTSSDLKSSFKKFKPNYKLPKF